MFHIAVLVTVYNRKETTLRCLESLYNSIGNIENHSFDIYLTDDKSYDGTSEAVRQKFPQVNILFGNGNLFWCRGMNQAWKKASTIMNYDFYLWLNDDGILFKSSISILINSAISTNFSAIIGGAFRSKSGNTPTYGGLVNDSFISPNGKLQEFNLLNGNLVLVPRIIYEKIGTLDSHFHHGMGDHDYGLRAKKAGFKLYLTPEYVGYCERHDSAKLKCFDNNYSIINRFQFLYSPPGPNPLVNCKYYLKHYSLLKTANFLFIANLLTAFPFLYGIKSRCIKWFDFFRKMET